MQEEANFWFILTESGKKNEHRLLLERKNAHKARSWLLEAPATMLRVSLASRTVKLLSAFFFLSCTPSSPPPPPSRSIECACAITRQSLRNSGHTGGLPIPILSLSWQFFSLIFSSCLHARAGEGKGERGWRGDQPEIMTLCELFG